MSVSTMKKLTVLAPLRDADRLMRRLLRLRCAEIRTVPVSELPDGGKLLRYDCDTARAEAERRVADVGAALTFLDGYAVSARPWTKRPIDVTTEVFEKKTGNGLLRILGLSGAFHRGTGRHYASLPFV